MKSFWKNFRKLNLIVKIGVIGMVIGFLQLFIFLALDKLGFIQAELGHGFLFYIIPFISIIVIIIGRIFSSKKKKRNVN